MNATIDAVWGIALIGFVLTLWLASLGAVWKVATLLSSITAELKTLRAETAQNTQAIAAIVPAVIPSARVRPASKRHRPDARDHDGAEHRSRVHPVSFPRHLGQGPLHRVRPGWLQGHRDVQLHRPHLLHRGAAGMNLTTTQTVWEFPPMSGYLLMAPDQLMAR